MMLPAGWVTGIDISRTAQLRCLGNSLVWLQAATAWAALLGVDTRERERERDGSDVADTASIRQQRTGNPRQRRTGPSDSDPMPLIPTPTAWLGRRPSSSVGDPARRHNPNRSNELSDFLAALNEEPNQ